MSEDNTDIRIMQLKMKLLQELWKKKNYELTHNELRLAYILYQDDDVKEGFQAS